MIYADICRIEYPVETPVAGGGRDIQWQEFLVLDCRIEALRSFKSAVEQQTSGGIAAMPPVRIHFGYFAGGLAITEAMRAVNLETQEVMNILSPPVDLSGARVELTLAAAIGKPS